MSWEILKVFFYGFMGKALNCCCGIIICEPRQPRDEPDRIHFVADLL